MIRRLRARAAANLTARAETIMYDIWADVSELADLAAIDWLDAYETIMGTTSGQVRAAMLRLYDALAQAARP